MEVVWALVKFLECTCAEAEWNKFWRLRHDSFYFTHGVFACDGCRSTCNSSSLWAHGHKHNCRNCALAAMGRFYKKYTALEPAWEKTRL